MKAKEARVKYFEDYVSYEFYLRKIANMVDIKTSGKKLSEVIDNLSSSIQFPSFELKSKRLKIHKSRRNWLAHQHGNSDANAILKQDFIEIKHMNKKLVKIIESIKILNKENK